MAVRSSDHPHPNPLSGYLTTREAAAHLNMSYWHFMHLVEAEKIRGIRIVDRWLFSPADLEAYRRSTKSGAIADLARTALDSPHLTLTPRQRAICQAIADGQRPAQIARQQQQSRQAVHAQIALIREKVAALAPLPAVARVRRTASAHPPRFTTAPLME
jgi:excisionase family DNA binding protein